MTRGTCTQSGGLDSANPNDESGGQLAAVVAERGRGPAHRRRSGPRLSLATAVGGHWFRRYLAVTAVSIWVSSSKFPRLRACRRQTLRSTIGQRW